MKPFRYRAYGLNIESELSCPELVAGQVGIPDVYIRYGNLPPRLKNPNAQGIGFEVKPDQFLFQVNGIARFMVSDGTEIVIEPTPNSQAEEVRLFLLGSAFGALLLQRGFLVLHASAIAAPKGAVLFLGPSGYGKSTLASVFRTRCYRVLTDDVCAMSFDAHRLPVVLPSYPQLKICNDMADILDENVTSLRRVRRKVHKYAVPIREHFARVPVPLHAVYALAPLDNSQALNLERLASRDKYKVLVGNTYNQLLLEGLGLQASHFQNISAVAKHAKISRVTRSDRPAQLEALADLLERDFV